MNLEILYFKKYFSVSQARNQVCFLRKDVLTFKILCNEFFQMYGM